ncbi:MAG: DUF3794 domain-containing protein [Clostridia bacterium]|nr:DUF3794 domain-containing protein [Clostridia bacterium]
MDFTLEKKELTSLVPGARLTTPVEGAAECIVPDALPDVLEILRTSATVSALERRTEAGGICLVATVEVCVLYRSDTGSAEVLRLQIPLRGDLQTRQPAERAAAELSLRRAEASIPNSRKVSVRIAGEVCLRESEEETCALPVGISAGEGMETDVQTLSVGYIRDVRLRDFALSDELELPAGAPEAREILGICAAARDIEHRLIPGKAVVKAAVDYRLWYLAADGVHDALFTMPFSQILELPGAEEDDGVHIAVSIGALSLREDEAGRIFTVTATGCVQAAVLGSFSCEVISDAYSTRVPVEAEQERLQLATAELRRMEMRLQERLECAGRIVSAAAEPLGLTFSGGKCTAEVAVTLLADEGEGLRPQVRRLTAEFGEEEALMLPTLQIDEVELLPAAGGAEVRMRLQADGLALGRREMAVLSALRESGVAPEGHVPAVTLRRAAVGERFFDIGRAYGAPLAALFAANGLAPAACVEQETMLIIPRK